VRRFLRILISTVTLIVPFALEHNPAHAECLSIEVHYWVSGNPNPQPILPKTCAVPTCWPFYMSEDEDYTFEHHHSGVPTGAGFTVWMPSPV
jgi:hypothetical protein